MRLLISGSWVRVPRWAVISFAGKAIWAKQFCDTDRRGVHACRGIFSLYALKLSCLTYVLSVTTQVSDMAKSHLEGKKF